MPTVIDKTLRPFHLSVYEALTEAWRDYGSSPSKDELSRACRCSSTTVHQAIRELRRRGYILAPKHGIRALKPTDIDRVILLEEPDPWADLVPKPKYWSGVKENARRNKPRDPVVE